MIFISWTHEGTRLLGKKGLFGLAALAVLVVAAAVVFAGSSDDAPPSDASSVEWASPVEVATGAARIGPWRMNESDWDYLDDPTLALTDDGTAGIAWVDQGAQEVFFQSIDADGNEQLETPTPVSQETDTFSWLPRMIIPADNPDTIYLLWQEIIFSGGSHGGDILFARSTDGGASFSDPINLSASTAGAGKGRLNAQRWDNGSLDLAYDADGTLYAAWTEFEGRLWVRRSTDGGASFDDPVHVAGDDETPARGPALAVDDAGTVHLAWTVGDDRFADIYHTTSDDRGASFHAPQTAAASDAHADAPTLTADSSGAVHLAFAEQTAPDEARYRIRHTRYSSGDGFDDPQTVESLPTDDFESASFPALHAGPGGSVYLQWVLYPNARDFRPMGLGLAVSHDNGASFSAPELVPGTADPELGQSGSRQGMLMDRLATNAAGDVALVNSTFSEGTSSAIWLHRSRQPAGGE